MRSDSLLALSHYGDAFELACLAAAAGNARRFGSAAMRALACLDMACASAMRLDPDLTQVKAVHRQTVDLAQRVLDEHTSGLPPGRTLLGLHELEARQFSLLKLLRNRYRGLSPRTR
jgi:hypothetical protein